MSEELRQLNEQIEFGVEVESFIRSKLGRYLIGRAESERDAALSDLAVVDPTDVKQITALQNKVKLAESFQYWLAEAIESGHSAFAALSESGV